MPKSADMWKKHVRRQETSKTLGLVHSRKTQEIRETIRKTQVNESFLSVTKWQENLGILKPYTVQIKIIWNLSHKMCSFNK